ncbi:MAG: protein kinase domain-containing protein, partial [Anaerolineae bacterium]
MIGALLQGRYRLDAELGRGGMGVVYRAHDTLLDRDVAVKVLSDTKLGTEGRARLLREAQSAAQLNHPNVVSVHDAGEADGAPFIVMELVEGESLHARRPTAREDMLTVVRQMCAALDHAHAHGIVHRDLKPENVLITPDGTAKLMDFGLARSGASRISTEGAIVGTVFYLAPEQALGQAIDGRADLYALGVMLYELTTGRLPFAGDDPLAVISQHLHAPVEPPRALRPDLPPALETIILKLLAKNPADRFASAREVEAALAEIEKPGVSVPRHNLPIQLTSFIGREKEMAKIKHLLSDSHLLTLTGPGGTGKTRLALQVAADLLEAFGDGVWLVELASLSDPDLVPQTVAAVLGVREEPNHPLTKALVDYLRPKSLLLILDNCEHLIDACAQLVEALLRACPNVKILASGREALGIAGETTFRVPSLSLPDIRHLPSIEQLTQYESVRLFIDRAIAVRPEFRLTDANAPAIAQICHRLDGVPLAIELAAARVRAMTAEQIAARLDDRFRLLTGGSRTALPRQQTLRALIDWSWDLLSDAERALLRRLSVFLSGWTLEAAEA